MFISFFSHVAWAQSDTHATMTTEFSDSLKTQIGRIITAKYQIRISYQSKISAEGKLLKPLITREVADGTVDDNAFVQKMRFLIMNAPAWKPAVDDSSKAIESMVSFDVEIKDGEIKITDKTE